MGMYFRAYVSFLHLHTIPFLIYWHAFIIPTTHILCVHPRYLGHISGTNPQKALLDQLPPCFGNHIFHLRRQRIFQGASGGCKLLTTNLPSKAFVCATGSISSTPPSLLSFISVVHATFAQACFSSVPPHKKFLIRLHEQHTIISTSLSFWVKAHNYINCM